MMKQHLRAMSSMIRELKLAIWNNLTHEQQVLVVIRSLPSSWEMMCQNLIHNVNIKTFDDVACHLELEAKHLEVAKLISFVHIAKTSSHKASRPKRKQLDYATRQERPTRPSPKKANRLSLSSAILEESMQRRTCVSWLFIIAERNDILLVIALSQKW